MEMQVLYRYSKIELEQFAVFEDNYSKDEQGIQIRTEVQFSFDEEISEFTSKVAVNFSAQGKPLMKTVLISYFIIQPESVNILRQNGKIIFPPQLLIQFASLCYGAMRGVIFTKTQGTAFSNYVLPDFNFGKVIDKGFAVEE